MALLAADPGAQRATEWLSLLRPHRGRLAYAARLALICALTALVTAVYRTPEPALATYVVLFMNRRDRLSSIVLSIAIVILITVVLGFVFGIANVVIDRPPL